MYTNRDCFNWDAFIILVAATVGCFLIPVVLIPILILSKKEKNQG